MKFKAVNYRSINKTLVIDGPDIQLEIDIDDCDIGTVAPLAKRLVTILNDHWDDEKYSVFKSLPWPPQNDEDETELNRRTQEAQEILRTI